MDLKFRQAIMADKDGLRQLAISSYGPYQNILTEENWNKLNTSLNSEDLYTELLKKSTGFICLHDEVIVGMAFLLPHGNPTDIFQEDWSYIRMVGVNPTYEGKGIGKKLTQMCIEHAKVTGEKIIALHTSEFTDAARHIYESIGFKQMKELPPRLGKKYWLYLLEL